MGCRVPGASSPAALWRLLCEGREAISEIPDARWVIGDFQAHREALGRLAPRGGFVGDVDQFDAAFWGISPREAASMDPQQRLLLELAWEALEDAGLPPERLRGAPVGVFVGLSTADYAFYEHGGSPYYATGNAASIASNRLSYCLDLRGVCLTLDTACSSSLVALHLACQSLLRGESAPVALAAGVNLMLSARSTLQMAQLGVLAPDGHCRSFGAAASGTVRGEGGCLVVLKRLEDALRDGDAIHAVIRGTAVNQDGRSNGLTAPNRWAQESVLRQAYQQAGVVPSRVQFIEAHGSGTPLGDPIEAVALGEVLGEGRDAPCALGSVKSNLGHLEAAAGLAGVLKAALALEHGELPPTLHAHPPSAEVEWARVRLSVQSEPLRLDERAGPAVGGVSAFGFGGTNAHAVLESPPRQPAPTRAPAPGPRLLLFSAQGRKALAAQVAQGAAAVRAAGAEAFPALCRSAALARSHLTHRVALVARGHEEAAAALEAFARGEGPAHSGVALPGAHPKVGFVFSGERLGAGAARALLASEPAFAAGFAEADAALRPHSGFSVADELGSPEGPAPAFSFACLFALHVALARLLEGYGVRPDAVLGLGGAGEVSAAWASGALTLAEAARVVAKGGQGVAARAAQIPLFSARTGERLSGPALDAAYWERASQPARQLAAAVDGAVKAGVRLFVELGPSPANLALLRERLGEAKAEPAAFGLLGGGGEREGLLEALGALHVRGVAVELSALFPPAPLYRLPTYPWQRQRHWAAGPPLTPSRGERAPVTPSEVEGRPFIPTGVEGRAQLIARVTELVAQALMLPPEELAPGDSLAGRGLDSLVSLTLKTAIDRTFGAGPSEGELIAADTVEGISSALERLFAGSGAAPRRGRLVCLREGSGPTLLLLPGTTGTAASMGAWIAGPLGEGFAAWAYDPPGHGTDAGVAPRQASEVLPGLLEQARALPRPLVLVGFSMGAVLAHALARALTGAGAPPAGLLLSHGPPPDWWRATRRSALPDQPRVWESLYDYQGLAARGVDRARFVASARADYELAESVSQLEGPPLAVPAVLLVGKEDELFPASALTAWDKHLPRLERRQVAGGHFGFLAVPENRAALRALYERLAEGAA